MVLLSSLSFSPNTLPTAAFSEMDLAADTVEYCVPCQTVDVFFDSHMVPRSKVAAKIK